MICEPWQTLKQRLKRRVLKISMNLRPLNQIRTNWTRLISWRQSSGMKSFSWKSEYVSCEHSWLRVVSVIQARLIEPVMCRMENLLNVKYSRSRMKWSRILSQLRIKPSLTWLNSWEPRRRSCNRRETCWWNQSKMLRLYCLIRRRNLSDWRIIGER